MLDEADEYDQYDLLELTEEELAAVDASMLQHFEPESSTSKQSTHQTHTHIHVQYEETRFKGGSLRAPRWGAESIRALSTKQDVLCDGYEWPFLV